MVTIFIESKLQDSFALYLRDKSWTRCAPFWFPEPHLWGWLLWWEWQSVPGLQKLQPRCSVHSLMNKFEFASFPSSPICLPEFWKFVETPIRCPAVEKLLSYTCFPGVVAQQSEMWFLDRSLCWHYLTPTFTSYYRLMITHLGLPEWQYAFTPYGPSPQAKVQRGPNANQPFKVNVLCFQSHLQHLQFLLLAILLLFSSLFLQSFTVL